MCLQDIQLIRACTVNSRSFSLPAGGTGTLVPADPSRIGFMITGPSSNPLDIRFGDNADIGHVIKRGTNSTVVLTAFMYSDYGPSVMGEWFFNSTALNLFTVYEYILPMDRDQLQRLANLGKF